MVGRKRFPARAFPRIQATFFAIGCLVLAAGLVPTLLALNCAPPPAVEPDDVRSIEDFVRCVNARLAGNPNATSADTVQCLPPKCTITLTMSNISAQPACFTGECQMPRVLLTCPGPPLFMPSYLLCPSDEGSERIEIGEAVDVDGNMRMADIHIVPGPFMAIDETAVISTNDSKGCNSNGLTCHVSHGPQQYSEPIDPFDGSEGSNGNPDCIIATDRCDQAAIQEEKGCFPTNDDPRVVRPQSLSKVCECIREGNDDPQDELSMEDRGPLVEALCDALEGYQSSRGACAVVGCPAASGPECDDLLAPCDPETGAPLDVASGYHCQAVEEDLFQCVADCPCRGWDLLGGGKFLVNTAVSMVRLELDGLVPTPDPGSFTDADGVTGELEAFNYLTRTLVQAVSFSSLEATQTGADFSASGTGTALVNGVPTNIAFTATQTGTVATFEVQDADTSAVLAGGTGEDNRAAFQLTVTP